MLVKYLDEYQTELFLLETDMVPRVGEMVYLDEIFYVKSVVWYPMHQAAHVIVSEHAVAKPKVAEAKEKVVNLAEFRQIKETAESALKASKTLKTELSNLREFVKQQPKAPTRNDS
jgi:hypothetical protein